MVVQNDVVLFPMDVYENYIVFLHFISPFAPCCHSMYRRGLEKSTAIFNAQTLKQQYKHQRYTSIDAWQYAASFENIVGRNKSMLMEQSVQPYSREKGPFYESETKSMNGYISTPPPPSYGSTTTNSNFTQSSSNR